MSMVRASRLFHVEHTSVSEQGLFTQVTLLVPCGTVKSHCSQCRKGMIIDVFLVYQSIFIPPKKKSNRVTKLHSSLTGSEGEGFLAVYPQHQHYPSSCGKKTSDRWSSCGVPFTALSRVWFCCFEHVYHTDIVW